MGEYKPDLAIHWDLESCSLPKKSDVGAIVQRARAIAGQHGRVVDFAAFLAHERQSAESAAQEDMEFGRSWSTLPTFGVKLEYTRRHGQTEVVDRRIIVDIPFYLKEHPSTTFIVLITADSDFMNLLSRLVKRGIGVAVISNNQAFERYQRSFIHVYHWMSDIINKAGVPLESAFSTTNGGTSHLLPSGPMEEDWYYEDDGFGASGDGNCDGDWEGEGEGNDQEEDRPAWGVGERVVSSRNPGNMSPSGRGSDSPMDSDSESSDSDNARPIQGTAKHPAKPTSKARLDKSQTSDSESSSSESSTQAPSLRKLKPNSTTIGIVKEPVFGKQKPDSKSSGGNSDSDSTIQTKAKQQTAPLKKPIPSSSSESSSSSENGSTSLSSDSDSDSSRSGTDGRKKGIQGKPKQTAKSSAPGSSSGVRMAKCVPTKSAPKKVDSSSSSDSDGTDSSDSESDSTESGTDTKAVKKVLPPPTTRRSTTSSSSDSTSSSESESESEAKKVKAIYTKKARHSSPRHSSTSSSDSDSSSDSSDGGESGTKRRHGGKPPAQVSPAKKMQGCSRKDVQDPMEVDEDRDPDAQPRRSVPSQGVKSYRDQATMTDIPGPSSLHKKHEPQLSPLLRTHQGASKRIEDEDEEWGIKFTTTMWERQRCALLGLGFTHKPLLKRSHPTAQQKLGRQKKRRKVANSSSGSSSEG